MRVKDLIPHRIRRFARRVIGLPGSLPYRLAARGLVANRNCARIEALRDRHQGRRCFVIGNGPSLNEMDLTLMKDEITIGSNAFYLAFDRTGFIPTYYTVEDPLPAEDNASVLNDLDGTIKVFPHDLRYCLRPTANTIYVFFDRYYSHEGAADFPRFADNAVRCVYWGGTVAYMGLQLAYYMGIREVYLIGVDLNYTIPDGAKGTVITSQHADPNHFHPDYFGPGKRWHLPRVDRMHRAFARAGEFFEARGGSVFNATVGGKLEALQRVRYESLFASSRQQGA